jgi:hypothetical protein
MINHFPMFVPPAIYMSACISLIPTGRIVMKFDVGYFYENVRKIQISLILRQKYQALYMNTQKYFIVLNVIHETVTAALLIATCRTTMQRLLRYQGRVFSTDYITAAIAYIVHKHSVHTIQRISSNCKTICGRVTRKFVCACVKLLIVIPLCTNTPQFINIHCFRITHSHFSSQSN